MKIYLVGGAVRDELLGYPIKERDWVVVGGRQEQLIAKGYRQVGRDFPVFLHPKTKEEYALARRERKLGEGYYGFECDANPKISLEDDLLRRDLTINAMAIDESGKLIDPFGGFADLQNKILRHVSAAFVEDPVRVLRVARFMARYQHLGFSLAPETCSLMYTMVRNGELNHLVPERIWQEWHGSLTEKNPECFIQTLRECGALEVVIPELHVLFGIPGSRKHHLEIDSGIHSLFSLTAAVNLSEEPEVRFAALVHDLGKAKTPLEKWPDHDGHEIFGIDVIEALCKRLRIPAAYRKLAVLASRLHLTIHRLFELNPSIIVDTLEYMDAFRRPNLFEQILTVSEADAKGCNKDIQYRQSLLWKQIYFECAKVTAKILITQGYEGQDIKKELHLRRIACVDMLTNSWKPNDK